MSGRGRIAYDAFGSGAAVVLLHPAHATRRAWADLGWVDAFTALGLRAVAIDARGFGDSARVSDPAALAPGRSSLDVAAVLDALAIESAHLCGYSLGAAQALRFALDRPARVRSLVLGGLTIGPLIGLDPSDPVALHRALREQGVPIESHVVAGVGHGGCFTHPEFREVATRFVAAQAGRG